uniref:Putative armadillo repeat-containing protein 8 n=1 Tax=Davidia involucrata TaxID=16924 RepID=A0A5B6ZSE1_DAVIN
MPASASTHRPEALIGRLSSIATDGEAKLKALRELKNQIIGNRTKKFSYIKLGAVPSIVSILSSAASGYGDGDSNSLLVQSAAAIGSFACGVDAGVKAVLDAGAFPHLLSLISHPNDKVVDAGARSLRMIYQSKLAPKYDFLQEKNMEFLLSLLNSENENVTGLGASIITHSCETSTEQKALSDAGILKKLSSLLGGSLSQRDASLEALATIFKENPKVISKFVGPESGRALSAVIELTKDKYPRTRLLACMCLIVIRNTSPWYLQDVGIKIKLILILLELLDDPGQVGDDAAFALSNLIAEKEDLQKLAFEANVVDKLCNHLQKGPIQAKRFQGILRALADLCSKLESCRSRLLSLQVLNLVTDALIHDSADVRAAACICLKNVSRSVKNLSAGHFMNEIIIIPLVQLLHDTSTSVQVAALGAISNIVVDFSTHKSTFIQCGGVKQLVQLSKSMDSTVRVNAVCALRNLMFLKDYGCKEGIFSELTASTLTSLIHDHESSVQEQALALVRNLVDGCIDSVEHVFAEDSLILHAVGRQLQSASKAEVLIQGMYVLSNVASGKEFHKEAVMYELFPQAGNSTQSIMVKFLQSNDSRLRTAAVWAVVNLTFPSSPGAFGRVVKLRNAGIFSQLKNMVNDHCLDVKLRVKTALGQSMIFGDGST